MRQRRSLVLLIALLAMIGATWSYLILATPPQQTLDQRVYTVALQLQCPVCQNESVAASSAAISVQMRQVIREQLQAGRSEQQVLDYFAAHYGNQILLTPPQQGFNLLAWLVPAAILLLGLGLVGLTARDWSQRTRQQTLSLTEQRSEEDTDLEPYRVQLERELADDDPLFEKLARPGLEIK